MNGFALRHQGQPQYSAEALDKAEALLKRFDVPDPSDRQIDMTVYLIRAFGNGGPPEGTVPPELSSVVKEMKGALPYSGFNLIDTKLLALRNGLRVEDGLQTGLTSVPYFYSLEFHEPSVSADGKTVVVQGFNFGLRVPVSTSNGLLYQTESISTPLTIQQGQMQVLGKIKLNSLSNDDLFVVLSCKVK